MQSCKGLLNKKNLVRIISFQGLTTMYFEISIIFKKKYTLTLVLFKGKNLKHSEKSGREYEKKLLYFFLFTLIIDLYN